MAKRPSLAESMKAVQQPKAAPVALATAKSEATAAEGQGSRYRAATREGMKRVTAVLPPEEHRRLKRLAVDTGNSIEDLMREALADLFAKHAV